VLGRQGRFGCQWDVLAIPIHDPRQRASESGGPVAWLNRSLRQAQHTGCDEHPRQIGDEVNQDNQWKIPPSDIHERIHRADEEDGTKDLRQTPSAHVLQDERRKANTLAGDSLKYIGPDRTRDMEALQVYLARTAQPDGGGSDRPVTAGDGVKARSAPRASRQAGVLTTQALVSPPGSGRVARAQYSPGAHFNAISRRQCVVASLANVPADRQACRRHE
jgi:hypothetical protein